jgi:glycosyltransferase involved in cell wall biosynthesis
MVIGAGPLRATLEEQARKLGLSDRVRFLGSLPQEQLADWYRSADLFVLPSHSEGVPNVLLEASACGTPWVASRVGGIPEIAHLGQSRLVTAKQAEELAGAMREMLAAPRASSGKLVRSLEEVAEEVEDMLLGVEAAHQGRLGKQLASSVSV